MVYLKKFYMAQTTRKSNSKKDKIVLQVVLFIFNPHLIIQL
jgi:hypothetical protein